MADQRVRKRQRGPAGAARKLSNQRPAPLLIFLLLKNFIWMDQALQKNRVRWGGTELSRTESQTMLIVTMGFTRPVEVAKSLGVTRQALNVTLNGLKDRGLIELAPDPQDKRCKVIVFAQGGQSARDDALEIMIRIERDLEERLGKKNIENTYKTLQADWGEIPLFEKPETTK